MPTERALTRQPTAFERIGSGFWRVILYVFFGFLFLLVGVITSIIVEWGGMVLVWEDQGAAHASNMLNTEMEYLDKDFKRQILGITPTALAEKSAVSTQRWLKPDVSTQTSLVKFLKPVYRTDNTAIEYAKRFYQWSQPFICAAHEIIVLYMVRLTIIVLSLPLIILVAIAWTVDGFCQRELRKDGGGRESSTKFKQFSSLIAFAMLAPFIFYLASPFPAHPNWVLAPIALCVATLVYMSASNYKKYW